MRVLRTRIKDFSAILAEISKTIPNKETLRSDTNKFLEMNVRELPAFLEDGSVAFYECGGVLLGKSALIKFIERCR